MDKRQTLTLQLEILWWVITAIVAWAVLYPIYKAMYVWPFKWWNVVFVVVLITLARYIFLLQHTFLARKQVLKVTLLLLMIPLTFILVRGLNAFMVFIEENTWDPLTGHLPAADKKAIENYIWTQMLFFGAGSIIAAPVFAGRLMLSIWRTHNRGTV
ncbi:MAG: hypothetical protein DYG98_06095 [Haliscomenobacteraceae bacterium CHB4]|nr:hypothetical protein [Saprospiraceae bacterium]MCE7922606.1 hypothetical protein [Haliscomenobacteraceae bacterium CHB4]